MKKFFKIVAIIFAVILALLITIPFLFKSKIEQYVKEKVNENVHAVVNWDRFGITFFRGFPDLSLNLKGVSVVGLDSFEGDTLAGFDRFEFRIKPFSAIRGDIVVEAIILDHPLINGLVLEDGTANWDIAPAGEAQDTTVVELDEEEEGGSVGKGVQLKRFSIKNGRIYYDDKKLDANAGIEGFNLDLKGDFSLEQTDMSLDFEMKKVNARVGGIRYLKDALFNFHLVAGADMVNSVYTLIENEIKLNGLVLGAEGSVTMPENGDMLLDLHFFTKKTTFRTLLSMVPAVYLEGFEDIRTSGSIQLDGTLKGVMNESRNPDLILNLGVKDGYFSYPDLPKDVTDVQVTLNINYNGENEDLTTVDLSTFHLEMAGNPIDVNLHIATPMSDMSVKGMAKGVVDFSTFSDVIPVEEVELEGRLETDIRLNTRMSTIENEDYENVDIAGKLIITDVVASTPDLPAPVNLSRIDLVFSPKYVVLKTFDVTIESSDLHMDGKLSNFIPYVFNGKTIAGELNVTSNMIDANLFMSESADDEGFGEESTIEETDTQPSALTDTTSAEPGLKIPENIDFKMKIGIEKVLYDNITIENLRGYIYMHDGIARLDALNMELLEGSVSTTGTVDTRKELTHVDMNLDIAGIDIPRSYETFVAVERLAPMAKYCEGTVNTKMNYESFLNASLEPVYESINAHGELATKDLKIYNLNSFVRLSELLKNEKFRNMAPDEIFVAFEVKEGRVIVEPFDINFDNSKMKVYGSHGIDLTMDYNIDMAIARQDLGAGANEMLSGINALAAGAGLKIPESDYIKVKAHIGGTFNDPKITTDLSDNLAGAGEVIEEQIRERVEVEVQKKEEEVREIASDEADKIISQAEVEAERLIEEAEKAGANLVKEAEKQGENLIREAGSNLLKKLAAQKAAEELKRQAEKQSDNIVNEARVQADEIINRAKAEAEKIEQ